VRILLGQRRNAERSISVALGLRAIRLAIAFAASASALLGAAPADAATYCVHHSGCGSKAIVNPDTMQLAANAADDGDTILVGSGEFDGFTNAPNDAFHVIGSGAVTVLRFPGDVGDSKTIVSLGGRADMSDLTVRLPTGASNTGVQSGTLTNVDVVSAGPQTGNSVGFSGGRFSDGAIDVPGGTGAAFGLLTRAVISAHNGVRSASLEDSVVRVSGNDGVGIDSSSLVHAFQTDLFGDGSPGTVAVEAFAFDSFVSANVRGSIIRGFATNFSANASAQDGGSATISVSYSDFDPAVPSYGSGGGHLSTTSHNTAADPGFVSGSDLHLRFDSPLVDASDPAAPFSDESITDLDGLAREVDGKGSGTPVADIGAFEYQPHPPAITAASASASSTSIHVPVSFHGEATDQDGEPVTLTWDFGDGQSGTGTDVTHVFETGGARTVRFTARDTAGKTATQDFAVDVVNHPPVLTVTSEPVHPVAGQLMAFHALASDPDGDPVTVVAWDFGDGRLATGSDPAHTYDEAGLKTVTATVSDPQGVTTVQTLQVPVTAVKPVLKCRVPKLKGKTLERAKAAIRKSGCKLGKVKQPRRKRGHKRPALVVRSQSPKAGKMVARGTKVNLKLGAKPKRKRRG
jgi:PKD repeat protein